MNRRRQADSERLHDALSALVGTPGQIDAIESGTSGTSYRVETAEGVFAAKLFYPHADVLLGPAEQFRLLAALAPADIAPAPVACDAGIGLLVTKWITDGRPVQAAELATPPVMSALVALLGTLHASDCAVPDYAPAAYLERYVDVLGGYRQLDARNRVRHDEAQDLAAWLDSYPAPKGLCHNDLTADNCFVGTRCRLIDFDFAVMAPAIVDLASLAEMNHFDESRSRQLLETGSDDGMSLMPAFIRTRRLLSLLAHFWALASADAGTAGIDQYRIKDD